MTDRQGEPCNGGLSSHVLGDGGVADCLGGGRVQARLAAHAAAVAAEAVHVAVGSGGVARHASRRVERVLFVYVIVITLPATG